MMVLWLRLHHFRRVHRYIVLCTHIYVYFNIYIFITVFLFQCSMYVTWNKISKFQLFHLNYYYHYITIYSCYNSIIIIYSKKLHYRKNIVVDIVCDCGCPYMGKNKNYQSNITVRRYVALNRFFWWSFYFYFRLYYRDFILDNGFEIKYFVEKKN